MLADDMNATGEFCHRPVRQAPLRQAHYARRAEVRPATAHCVPSEPIWGYVARLKTRASGWQELAQFYVRKDKAGDGVLSEMANVLIANIPPRIKLFGITKNPAVAEVFARHGLLLITKAVMPDVEEWADEVGLGKRLPPTALHTDGHTFVEGSLWLFVQGA